VPTGTTEAELAGVLYNEQGVDMKRVTLELSHKPDGTSSRCKPLSSMNAIRPANVSLLRCIRSSDADPSWRPQQCILELFAFETCKHP
jgi:hypothetical protein